MSAKTRGTPTVPMFRRLLVANRGEVAVRIGIDVENFIAADLAGTRIGLQLGQGGLPLRRVGREDFEPSGGELLLGAFAFGFLDGGATGQKRGGEDEGK